MSLTRLLNDRNSALTQFMAAELPDTGAVLRGYRERLPAGGQALVVPRPPDGIRPASGTINAALDHRLRFSLAPAPAANSIARGVAKTSGTLGEVGMELLSRITVLVEEHQPWVRGRPLLLSDDDAEDALDRACYSAALFEEVYRTSKVWPGSPLAHARSLDGLLAAVPAYALADIRAMVQLAEAGLREVRAGTGPDDVHVGPIFAGSSLVGGADADWVAGRLLGDVKATASPRRLEATEVWQLIGYVLLDFDDRYLIDRVGWYVARVGALVSWEITEFADLLGARRGIPELRSMLSELLSAGRRPASEI